MQTRPFWKEQYVVLMSIRVCDKCSKRIKPAKPPGIFNTQTPLLFECHSCACPRVREIVVDSRETYDRSPPAHPQAIKSLTLQKPIIRLFDDVCIRGRDAMGRYNLQRNSF